MSWENDNRYHERNDLPRERLSGRRTEIAPNEFHKYQKLVAVDQIMKQIVLRFSLQHPRFDIHDWKFVTGTVSQNCWVVFKFQFLEKNWKN